MAHFTLTPRPYPTYTPTPNREFTSELRAIWLARYGVAYSTVRAFSHPLRVKVNLPVVEVRGGSLTGQLLGRVQRTLPVGQFTDFGDGSAYQPLTQEDADLVNRIRYEVAARAQALGVTPTYPTGDALEARQLFTPAQLRLLGLNGFEPAYCFHDTLAHPAVVD